MRVATKVRSIATNVIKVLIGNDFKVFVNLAKLGSSSTSPPINGGLMFVSSYCMSKLAAMSYALSLSSKPGTNSGLIMLRVSPAFKELNGSLISLNISINQYI